METSENLIIDFSREFEPEKLGSNEKFESVKAAVNELIVHDFNRLLELLYRIDIPEVKLKKALQEQPTTDAAEIVTRLLIERQIQKINSRREFNHGKANIPEEEKW